MPSKLRKPKVLSHDEIKNRILGAVPDGWRSTVILKTSMLNTYDRYKDETTDSIVLESNLESKAILIFRVSMYDGKASLDGTTLFTDSKGNPRTFDRRGVDSSFSWCPSWCDDELNVQKIIIEQLENIAEAMERSKTAIPVPQIGFTIQPKTLEEYKDRLKKGLSISFMPSGFGTGYRLTTRRPKHAYVNRATKPLADFFNVPELWIENLDCD